MKIQTTNTQNTTFHVLKTLHEGFVTGSCLIPSGEMHVEYARRLLPTLLASALGLGTKHKSEEALNEAMESRGISINITSGAYYTVVSFVCLKQDIKLMVDLIHEQLLEPAFNEQLFESLKGRIHTSYESLKDSTSFRAAESFSGLVYPAEHISNVGSIDEKVALLQAVKVADLNKLHSEYDPLLHIKWIVVGDIDEEAFIKYCDQYKAKTNQVQEVNRRVLQANLPALAQHHVEIKEKQSVDLIMGHSIPIERNHPDYLPLKIAIDALGGSFSARLMRTVRDEDGLTYNVGSYLEGFVRFHEGNWCVKGSFSPKLLGKGIKSIQKQLDLWVNKGIDESELKERQEGIVGKHLVGLSSAHTVAAVIQSYIVHGEDLERYYAYPDLIRAVSVDDVNRVIKQYIDLTQMIQVTAGTLG